MTEPHRERIALSTGVTLDVLLGGVEASSGVPMLFLHGFPESARTWRHQLAEFSDRHRVAAPDQRGYASSDKPGRVEDYKPARLVADVLGLADALGWDRFLLVAHDWGGAVGWATALAHPDRLAGLVIANSPHPYIFQKTLIEHPAQRAASQYINDFRDSGLEAHIAAIGIEQWFHDLFADYERAGLIGEDERAAYLADWAQPGAITGMLNWYRASPIAVPPMDAGLPSVPWLDKPFPKTRIPVQVVWGVKDKALLPVQLDGLHEHVPDLQITRIDAGHFSPWEAPAAMNAAIGAFVERLGSHF